MYIIYRRDIGGLQNAEKYISELFKEVGKHKLLKVQLDGNMLTLQFDRKESVSVNNFVKQGSKKKYKSIGEFMMVNQPRDNQSFLGYVQTQKYYFLFFN